VLKENADIGSLAPVRKAEKLQATSKVIVAAGNLLRMERSDVSC
jgi:hypothetical protein